MDHRDLDKLKRPFPKTQPVPGLDRMKVEFLMIVTLQPLPGLRAAVDLRIRAKLHKSGQSPGVIRLDVIRETPADFASNSRPVEETSTRALRSFITRMKRAGENVAREEVEYYYRFSYSLIGLVVVLLGLPLSVRLRRGGVMFGLGLGLLLSFMYWGAIQTSRAFGTSHVISTALAAWLPNIVFGTFALILVLNVDR